MRMRPSGSLPRRDALLARLDRVIERVAHDVHQRVDELLDDQLVELGVGAASSSRTSLPGSRAGGAPRATASRTPGASGTMRTSSTADWSSRSLRSSALCTFAKSLPMRAVRRVGAQPRHQLADRAALDHELADEVHQLVELVDVDAHRVADRLERFELGPPRRRRGAAPATHPRRASALRPRARGLRSLRRGLRGSRRGARRARAAAGAAAPRREDRAALTISRRRAVGRHEQREADLRLRRLARRRQRREHLADLANRRRELDSPSSNEMISKVESIRADVSPAPDVLAQAVLLVLGERAQQRRLERRARRTPPSAAGASRAAWMRAASWPIGSAAAASASSSPTCSSRLANRCTDSSISATTGSARGTRPSRRPSRMSSTRCARSWIGSKPNSPASALERVRRAEQRGSRPRDRRPAPAARSVVQVREVLAHAVEDLLGLGDELLVRLAARTALARSARHGAATRAAANGRADPGRPARSVSGAKGLTR